MNNYNSLDTCHRQMVEALKKLKKLVSEIGAICKEGMTAEQQAKIKQQVQSYTTMARKLADEHNSQPDPDIAARNPGVNTKLTLEETRDLAEIAESAFIMNLVLSFDGASRAKIASKIGCRSDEESIALALLTNPDFRSNPDLLDLNIPLDYKTTPISEFNCAWWILKVYVAGIKPPSNTTVDIQNLFIVGITNTLLNSPHIKDEHILLIGCSLASIGSAAAKDKLRLIYAFLIRKIEENNKLKDRIEEIDRPAVQQTLVLLNLYRSLIGLLMRDRSVAKFPLNFKHWCIDTEQSTQSITFYADDTRDRLNDLLLNIRPQSGTHLVSLLKRKYHGVAVDRVVQMITPPPAAVAKVAPPVSPAAQAKAPPQPVAPPKPPAPAAAKPPAAISREPSHPVPEDEDDPLFHLLNRRKRFVAMARDGQLGLAEAAEFNELNRVIKVLVSERDALNGGSSLRTLTALEGERRSGQSSPSAAQQLVPPPGSLLPPPPQPAPPPSEPPPQPRRQLSEAEQRALAASIGFYPGYVSAGSPQAAPPAKPPAISRAQSEALLGSGAGALPISPSSSNIGGSQKFASSRGVVPLTATAPPPGQQLGSAYVAADPSRPNIRTLARRDSDLVPPDQVPARTGSSSNLGRPVKK